MRLAVLFLTIALFASLCFAHANNADAKKVSGAKQSLERTVAAEADVNVSVCLMSGDITVRGWDKREVRARSSNAEQMELRRTDAASTSSSARHIEVLISGRADDANTRLNTCRGLSDVELDVPRGATVRLNTRDGNVRVTDVADVRVQTINGDINLQRVAKAVGANSIGGNISLKNSGGRVNLHSISGGVQATDAVAVGTGDDFEAKSVSGDVTLERIGHARVQVVTVSGSVSMNSTLARGGRFGFKTVSGDVTLTLPGDSSFQIIAKVSRNGEIITDFPLKLTGEAAPPGTPRAQESAPPAPPDTPASTGSYREREQLRRDMRFDFRHLIGTFGTGDATINLSSFNGTVRLRRK